MVTLKSELLLLESVITLRSEETVYIVKHHFGEGFITLWSE